MCIFCCLAESLYAPLEGQPQRAEMNPGVFFVVSLGLGIWYIISEYLLKC